MVLFGPYTTILMMIELILCSNQGVTFWACQSRELAAAEISFTIPSDHLEPGRWMRHHRAGQVAGMAWLNVFLEKDFILCLPPHGNPGGWDRRDSPS